MSPRVHWLVVLTALLACASHAEEMAGTAPPAPAAIVEPPKALPPVFRPSSANIVRLPANTVVQLEVVDAVSSASSLSGDHFALRLASPLMVGEQAVLPAGTPVIGEVVHAASSSFGGKPGELLLAARYIDVPQGPIRLRSSFGAAGQDRNNLVAGVAGVVGLFGLAIKGREYELPAGSLLSARVASETDVHIAL